jgi:hypothetical protein
MEKGARKRASRRFDGILIVFIVVLALCLLLRSQYREFNKDEFEHIHSTWYVEQGRLPFKDFFQHHHPLFWYALVPVIWLFGETITTVLVIRLLTGMLALCIAAVSAALAKKISGSRTAGLLTAFLLLAQFQFTIHSVEIRPDIPQILFALLSVYFFLASMRKPSARADLLSGFFLSLSFIFLQKTVFLCFFMGLLWIHCLIKGKMSFQGLLRFFTAFCAPLALFVLYLAVHGLLEDYLLTNWAINFTFARGDRFTVFKFWRPFVLKDWFFWLSSLTGMAVFLRSRKVRFDKKTTALLILGLLASLVFYRRAHVYYYLFPLSLMAVPAGVILNFYLRKSGLRSVWKALVCLALASSSLFFIFTRFEKKNALQLERAAHVLKNTSPSEAVYDGDNLFNLFRPDLHYFWFSLKPTRGLDTYNRITGGEFADYDICTLIRRKNPKFISDFRLDLEKCGLDENYIPVGYPHLFIRRGSIK